MDLRFKKIKDYTSGELEFAITEAIAHCKHPPYREIEDPDKANSIKEILTLDFWTIFRGFDAYMEKRRRKEEADLTTSFTG